MSMGGGSGGSGNQTNTFTPPLWTLNQFPDYVQAATNLASSPQQHYYGQKIAGINDTQAQGMQMLANYSGNTDPAMAAARRNAQITASGGYENPYSSVQTLVPGNPYADPTRLNSHTFTDINPYLNQTTDGVSNEYIGMSDKYQAMKQASMDDVVKNYQNAVAPGTASAFNRAGAFHSGAYDAAQAADKDALARNLFRAGNEMDVGQWQRSGDLQQQLLGMNQQAQQNDLSRQTAGQQNWLNYQQGAQQNDINRLAGLNQQQIQMGVQAQQADRDAAAQGWNQERDRSMGAFGQALQGAQFDQNNAKNMIGIGDIQRGYTQDVLNSQFGDWQNTVNYPQTMLDNYANALARASGNYGSNSTSYNQPMYQANPFASAIGAGLLGAGAYNAWGSP